MSAAPLPWEKYSQLPEPGPWAKYGNASPAIGAGTAQDYAAEKSASGSLAPPLRSHWDATKYGLSELGGGIADVGRGLYDTFKPPQTPAENVASAIPAGLPILRTARGLYHLGGQALQIPGAISSLAASPDPWGTIALAAPRTAGQGVGNIALSLAPEAAAKVGAPVVRGAAKGTNVLLQRAPGVVGAGAGYALGHTTGIPQAIAGAIGYGIGREILPQLRVPGETFGLPKAPEILNPSLVSPARTMPGQIAPERIVPEGPIPGVTARPSLDRIMPPRKGLLLTGEVAQPGTAGSMANSILSPIERTAKPTMGSLQQQISDALGGKAEVVPPLPGDFTPVESGALQGYKYDAAKQELSAVTKNGQTYTYGEVTPEEAKAFQETPSKGTAWKVVRDNHVQVQKNGLPTKPVGPRSASPEDLAPEWQKTVDYLKKGAKKGA